MPRQGEEYRAHPAGGRRHPVRVEDRRISDASCSALMALPGRVY
ncbi:hypothetical protein [Streptomyces pratensis]